MAYMPQEKKQLINAALKKVMPKDWKWSLSVRHHSTIVLTIQSAPVDLCQEWADCINAGHRAQAQPDLYAVRSRPDNVQVNTHYPENQFSASLPVIEAALECLNDGNHYNSDFQTDYFDVGWYVDINLGRWDKPFNYMQPVAAAA
jgi:hypothetical protein